MEIVLSSKYLTLLTIRSISDMFFVMFSFVPKRELLHGLLISAYRVNWPNMLNENPVFEILYIAKFIQQV